jgi:hypothetical protein
VPAMGTGPPTNASHTQNTYIQGLTPSPLLGRREQEKRRFRERSGAAASINALAVLSDPPGWEVGKITRARNDRRPGTSGGGEFRGNFAAVRSPSEGIRLWVVFKGVRPMTRFGVRIVLTDRPWDRGPMRCPGAACALLNRLLSLAEEWGQRSTLYGSFSSLPRVLPRCKELSVDALSYPPYSVP